MRIYVCMILMVNVLFANDTITLEQAIQKVKQHNIEINMAQMDEQIKVFEHSIAQGSMYGSVDLSQSVLRSNDALGVFGFKLQSREVSNADFIPNDLNHPQDRNHFQTTVSYTVPLYSGGRIEQYQQITKALKVLSSLEKEELIAEKIYELKKSFYAVSLLNIYLKHLKTILQNTENLEKKTRAMYEEGYSKYVDVLEIQTRLSDVERQVSQTKANQALLYHFISFLINEPVNSIEGIYENAIPVMSIEENNKTLGIQKAEKGVEISQMNIALQEAAFFPQIDAFVRYGSGSEILLNDFSKNDAYTAGVQLRWNIFRGGSDKNSLEKARVEKLKAQQQLLLAQKSVKLQIAQMQTKIDNHDAYIMSLNKELALIHQIYENYAERYSQKLVSINDVLIKQSEELTKLLNLKEVQNARNETIFALEKLIHKELK